MGFLVFLLVILCCLLSALPSFGKIISKTWEVEYMHWSPDCVDSIVMGINGEFPGPEIRAVVGDTLNITVKNKLHTEGVVIHWHGILQKGTPWFDGTASISQCPINPGETFVYKFVVDKPGTYFYHGHYGMQRAAGLYGSLIVEDPKEGKEDPSRFPLYDDEFNLLLSDWWHRGVHAQEVDLSSNPFRFIGEPQTLLINGRGQYNCSITLTIVPARLPIPYRFPSPPSRRSTKIQCNYDVTTEIGAQHKKQCGPVILNVKQGKTYRLRVASTTSLSSLNLQIQNHKMTVVEADGNYVKPFEVDDLDIYSGESYSVLITTDKLHISDKHWISVGVRGRKPDTPQALAILSYDDNNNDNNGYPISIPPITPAWDNYTHSISFVNRLFANAAPQLLKNPNEKVRTIKLLNTQSNINGYIKWAINGISLSLPQTPYLGSIKYDLKDFDQTALPDEYDGKEGRVSSGVFNIAHNEVVHVILQNAKMLDGKHSEIHPWHLHGHDFWVLGYGEGTFDETKAKLNFVNPPLKNTVSVFPHGWTALRFKADNPGVWAFHCHIEPHLHMGMGVIFVEAENVIKKMSVPNEAISCGYSAKFLMNPNNHHHHHHHHSHHHSHHHKTNALPAPSPQPSPQG